MVFFAILLLNISYLHFSGLSTAGGQQLCAMSKEEFIARAPPFMGDILWAHLEILQQQSTSSVPSSSTNTSSTKYNYYHPSSTPCSTPPNDGTPINDQLSEKSLSYHDLSTTGGAQYGYATVSANHQHLYDQHYLAAASAYHHHQNYWANNSNLSNS